MSRSFYDGLYVLGRRLELRSVVNMMLATFALSSLNRLDKLRSVL